MAFSALFLENLDELKTRRGNATDTTLALVVGLTYPPDSAIVFYRWYNLATDTPDDDNIVQPTIGGIPTGRWFKLSTELTYTMIIEALGFLPYDASNPAGYITVEVDPIWTSVSSQYRTKAQNDLLYQVIGSYLTSETDPTVPNYSKSLTGFSVIKSSTDPLYRPITYVPIWTEIISKPTTIGGYGITDFNSLGDARWSLTTHIHTFASLTSKPTTLSGYGIIDAYPLTGNPSGFLTNYTETDPTVPAYSKTLSAFSVIKSSTDSLYKTISYTPTSLEITTALGFTPYNSSNPSNYITLAQARAGLTLTTTGTGVATYNNTTGALNIPSPSFKRRETYTGTTNASGIYTVTFATPFSATPNIQANIVGGSANQVVTMTRTTTGFTCTVVQRSAVTLLAVEVLLAATTPVSGATLDVLITEN